MFLLVCAGYQNSYQQDPTNCKVGFQCLNETISDRKQCQAGEVLQQGFCEPQSEAFCMSGENSGIALYAYVTRGFEYEWFASTRQTTNLDYFVLVGIMIFILMIAYYFPFSLGSRFIEAYYWSRWLLCSDTLRKLLWSYIPMKEK